jgi:uncharacterized protein (TIGR02246 family)
MTMQGISDINNRFVDAIGRSDSAGMAALYTEDGKVMATGSPTVAGREAVQQFWRGLIDMGAKSVTLQTVDLDEQGDTAIETGAYTLSIEPDGAAPMKDIGKYVIVWKRQPDGTWKMAIDIFNPDLAS